MNKHLRLVVILGLVGYSGARITSEQLTSKLLAIKDTKHGLQSLLGHYFTMRMEMNFLFSAQLEPGHLEYIRRQLREQDSELAARQEGFLQSTPAELFGPAELRDLFGKFKVMYAHGLALSARRAEGPLSPVVTSEFMQNILRDRKVLRAATDHAYERLHAQDQAVTQARRSSRAAELGFLVLSSAVLLVAYFRRSMRAPSPDNLSSSSS